MSGPLPSAVDLAGYVSAERVVVLDEALGKREALSRLIDVTMVHPLVTDKAGFAKAIHDREEVTSTGIGGGVAVPHARLASINGFVITIGIFPKGIDFSSQDRHPVHVAVMIAATDQDRKTYLMVLATVAARLRTPRLVQHLLAALPDRQRVADLFLGR
ncbi:MAG: PTS sugar transporter subunit IIA [Planctomycetes bacterium]|nr:PTS sugar transporter subunit IIA [Planctomycetota bacterium]